MNETFADQAEDWESCPASVLYFTHFIPREGSAEEARATLTRNLQRMMDSNPRDFAVLDRERILGQYFSVAFPRGVQKGFYVSNATTLAGRGCGMKQCRAPAGPETCWISQRPCQAIYVRPAMDSEAMQAMFPGNRVIGARFMVTGGCPYGHNGLSLRLKDLVWMPKCGKGEYEVLLKASTYEGLPNGFNVVRRRPPAITGAFLAGLPSISERTTQELAEWRNFLAWRARLVNANKRQLRYVGREVVKQKGELVVRFRVIAENEAALKANRMNGQDAVVAALGDSEDRWQFRERMPESGRQHRHAKYERLGDFRGSEVEGRKGRGRIPPECPWSDPAFGYVTFALPDQEEGEEWDEDDIPYPEVGFIFSSAFGDDVLIRRMNGVIRDFGSYGSNASPYLPCFLFDSSKARLPMESRPVEKYLNANLTEDQRHAVQVMLDAPDLALLQGPPGTGKTTVIAEAIYQFAMRGNRVLLASQSGTAVDNALERLGDVPEVRAIRLQRVTRDNEDRASRSRFSEANAFQNYYRVLREKPARQLAEWDRDEARLRTLTASLPRLEDLVVRIRDERNEIARLEAVRDEATAGIAQADEGMANAEQARADATAGVELAGKIDGVLEGRPFEALPYMPEPVADLLANEWLSGVSGQMAASAAIWQSQGYDVRWTEAVKARYVNQALSQYALIANGLLPQLRADVVKYRAMSGESLCSDEQRMRLDEISIKIADALRRMEADESEICAAATEEWRRLTKERKAIESASGVNAGAYAVYCRDSYLEELKTASSRSEYLERLEACEKNFSDICSHSHRSLEAVAGRLRAGMGDADLEERARRLRASSVVRRDESLRGISEAKERAASFDRQTRDLLSELSRDVGLPVDLSAEAAVSWCRKRRDDLQASADGSAAARGIVRPVLEAWVAGLGNPNEQDRRFNAELYGRACSVVGITCTTSEHLLREKGYDAFDVVIVDEVSKATPPELLMPMMHATKIILVGDHRQLPPVFNDREPLTFEEIAQSEEENDEIPEEQKLVKQNFGRYKNMVEASLFKSLFSEVDPRLRATLLTQFRMHPDIMRAVNEFYDNKLVCGLSDPDQQRAHGLGPSDIAYIRPDRHLYWIDSSTDPRGEEFYETQSGSSKENLLEAELIRKTLLDLDRALEGKLDADGKPLKKSVAVISFYGRQKGLLERMIKGNRRTATQALELHNIKPRVETVDRFQGQECDYVLVSLTRNPTQLHAGKKSFVAKFERINVAFSRAKELLLVFGARRMFGQFKVPLSEFKESGEGAVRTVRVYGHIIEESILNGAFVPSGEILSEEAWKAACKTYVPPQPSPRWRSEREGGRRDHGFGKGGSAR